MKIDQTSSFKREFKRIKNKHYKMDELKKQLKRWCLKKKN